MRSTHNRVNGWLVGGAASSIMAIAAALIISGTKDQSAAAGRPRPVASPASTQNTVPPPTSTARAEHAPSPERHPQRSEEFAAAMKLALQQGDELNDEREAFELGYRWVSVAPEAALDFVLSLPFDHTLLLVALANEWTRRDPASAGAWAARLPEGTYRTRALPSLVAVWAETAPVEATRFAIGLTPPAVQTEAIVSAVSGWARQDPLAALEWAGRLPPGKLQEQIYTQGAFTWGQRDPVSAAEWLRSMPDGQAWDATASALCGVLVERHPALALSLAADIADEEIRNRRIENVGRRWLAADRAAAEDALIHSDLPAAFVARLLR